MFASKPWSNPAATDQIAKSASLPGSSEPTRLSMSQLFRRIERHEFQGFHFGRVAELDPFRGFGVETPRQIGGI